MRKPDYVMIPRNLIEREDHVSYQSPDWKPDDQIIDQSTLWCVIHSAVIREIDDAGALPGKKKADVIWDANNDGFVTVKGELDVNGMASLIEFYVRAFLRAQAVVNAFKP